MVDALTWITRFFLVLMRWTSSKESVSNSWQWNSFSNNILRRDVELCFVQIADPARGRGKDVQEVQSKTAATFIEIAECCLVTAVRDGMNLIPYEYIICMQVNAKLNETIGLDPSAPKKSFGLGFRVVALDLSFKKLSIKHIVSAYKRTKNRVILVDYYGTMVCGKEFDLGLGAEHEYFYKTGEHLSLVSAIDWKQ
ncbi:hypothetical protein Rs2_07158 [Raphanus sativus]|nr:hypothetical protein Rs2_07158 [Raphanus sativus]